MKYGYKVILKDPELKHYGKSKKDGAPGVGTGNWKRDHHGASVNKGRSKETGAEKIARTLHNIKWKTKYHFNAARDKEKFENNPNEFKKKKLESALNDDKWDMDFLEATQNEDWTADENGKPSKRMVEEYKKYLDNPEKYVSQQDFDKGNFGPAMAKLSGKDFDGDKAPEVGSGIDFDGDTTPKYGPEYNTTKIQTGKTYKINEKEFKAIDDKYGKYLEYTKTYKDSVKLPTGGYLNALDYNIELDDNGNINSKEVEKQIKYFEGKEFESKAFSTILKDPYIPYWANDDGKIDEKFLKSTLRPVYVRVYPEGNGFEAAYACYGNDKDDWLGGHAVYIESAIDSKGSRHTMCNGLQG